MEAHSDISDTLELSSIQKLIWFGQQAHPKLPIYNAAYTFRFHHSIDRIAFERAHEKLVSSTDTLRITFKSVNQSPRQQFQIHSPGKLEVTENTTPDEDFDRLLHQEAARILDLSLCPWRSHLYVHHDGSATWLLVQHHLLTDGVAYQIIFARILAFYETEVTGAPELNTTFPSYQEWIKQQKPRQLLHASKSDTADNRGYSRLYSEKAPTGAPFGKRRVIAIDGNTCSDLDHLVQLPRFASFSKELSLNFVLLTSQIALLSRVERSRKLCIGVALHGRRTPGAKETAGAFVEVRPLSIEIQEEDTFATLYETVRETYFSLASSSLEIDSAQEFDVTFSFLAGGFPNFAGQKVEAHWIYPGCHENANRWRIHFMIPHANGLTLISDTNDEAFSEKGAQLATRNLLDTLTAFITDPDQRVQNYRLVRPGDLSGSLLSGPPMLNANDTNIWQAFEGAARRKPNSVAIRTERREVSYADLSQSTINVSEAIADKANEGSQIVPIVGPRSLEMIQASLAAIRSGKGFLPIDPALPPERIRKIIEDSGSSFTINLDHDLPRSNRPNRHDPPKDGEIAYVIYTSGSTDIPNGVAVGHRSVLNLVEDMERRAPLEAGSNCMWWTAVSFDVSIYEIFSSILYGHTLCIPPETLRLNPKRLFEWMEEQQINSTYLPPFMLAELNTWLDSTLNFPLKRLLVGVEPIQEELLVSIAGKISGLKIVNGYGPTEATICATFYEVDSTAKKVRRTPIGTPVSGNRCYILDQQREPMPQGAVGELYIAGSGLALGYWNRTELTNHRFLPDPFTAETSDVRMYKTGDLARLSDEGDLQYIGRVDSQIKLRGSRIDPGEVERSISSHPNVHRSAITVRKISGQDEIVCFYLSSIPLEEEALHAHAAKQLPFQLLPKRFQHLEKFPSTINGKIDFDKLPEIQEQRFDTSQEPEGPVEERVAEVWKDALKIDTLSVTQTFFELGGSSLPAMEMMLKLCREFEIDLPIQTVFAYPTIRKLAAVLEDALLDSIDELTDEEAAELLGESDI